MKTFFLNISFYGTQSQSVGGLDVAVCLDNSSSPTCSDNTPRCYGRAIDLYGNFDLTYNEPYPVQTTDVSHKSNKRNSSKD